MAKLKVYGPFDEMVIATTCTKKATTVQHTYLVDVCDEDKDRYRFGFNGQEKVNEIAGVGNHNTAQFWEYDTRLGRRWNVDPKPNESISSYGVFGGNPIMYSDINGDTLKVEYKGKQLVYGKDGEFYDGDKKVEIGKYKNGKYKNFVGEVHGALNSLKGSAEGESIINELVASKNNFVIEESQNYGMDENGSNFEADNFKASVRNNPEFQRLMPSEFPSSKPGSGSGGRIRWNPYNNTSGYNTAGNFNNPAFIVLGHEMVHARDANRGTMFSKTGYKAYTPKWNGLWKTEWRAVYYENVIRGQLTLPLRSNYGIDVENGTKTPQKPYLLDKDKEPINYTGEK